MLVSSPHNCYKRTGKYLLLFYQNTNQKFNLLLKTFMEVDDQSNFSIKNSVIRHKN